MKAIPARLAAFRVDNADHYGVVTDRGIVDLTAEYGARFRGLKEVVEAGALEELVEAAEGREPDYQEDQVTFLVPIANPEKLICCLLYTSPSPRDGLLSRMPSSA